jgi:hypothetical protein
MKRIRKMHLPSSDFKPWRADFKDAFFLGLFALSIGAVALYLVRRHWGHFGADNLPLTIGVICSLASCFLGIIAWRSIKQGYYRWRGAFVEKQSVSRLQSRLPIGWTLKQGVRASSGGDIDIVLRSPDRVFAVEVKSVESSYGFDSFFTRLLGIGVDPRAIFAVEQAKRSALSISPHAVPAVWLPKSDKFKTVYKDVLVIGGNERYFLKKIQSS